MGYYTRYTLQTEPDDDYNKIRREIKYFGPVDDNEEYEEILGGDGCKWYSWDEDMRDIAERHPETLIILDGEGEKAGDQWRAFFKGGKQEVHKAKWVPPVVPTWEHKE